MNTLFLLLIIFQLKHFLSDYPLQTKYMLGKFKPGFDCVLPLSAHCLVHSAFTFTISLFFTSTFNALLLACFDFFTHFTMDIIKASPQLLGRFKAISKDEYKEKTRLITEYEGFIIPRHPAIQLVLDNMKHNFNKDMVSNKYFWWSLGLDQMVHHVTHYFIIWKLLSL